MGAFVLLKICASFCSESFLFGNCSLDCICAIEFIFLTSELCQPLIRSGKLALLQPLLLEYLGP